MSDSIEIRVPRDIVNDDFVTVVEWKVETGDHVSPGDIVVLVETAKSILEIQAESAGTIEVLHIEGAEVEVGAAVGRVNAGMPVKPGESVKSDVADSRETGSSDSATLFSAKAKALSEDHGIPADVFSGRGLIREADVLQYIRQVEQDRDDSVPGGLEAVREVDNSNEPLAESVTSAKESLAGQSLWADARASASERSRGIPWLVWNYIWRNWFLGNLLRWAPRFATLAIHRARGVKVGLGCFIDPSAIMETAFPENISIGDDVRIAAAAVIMTHIKPPHYLRQTGIMDSVIKPVRIEDHVFIGVSAVLAPGVVVGKAAVVANGAVVVNNVPPFTMVAGNPAAVVKRFTKPMDNG